MRDPSAVLAVLLTTLAAAFPPASAAQIHTSAVGLTLGGSVHGDLTPGLPATTRFESGWIAGLQYERWIGKGRVGIRANTLFTQRLLSSSPGGDYNVYMGDVGALLRVLPLRDDRIVTPFVGVGLGATHYGSVAGSGPLAGGVYGENATRPYLVASVGVDIASSGPVGFRVELGDEIVFPSVGYSPSFSGLPNVHNLLTTVALQYRMGRRAPGGEGAAARPAPGPAPQPSPDRGPEPDPRPRPDPDGAREDGPRPSSIVEDLRLEVDSLEAHVAELERQVDSLQTRIAALERETASQADALDVRARYTVQVSAFLDSDRADRLTAELRADGVPTWRWDAVTRNRTFSRVRVGALPTRAAAERLAQILKRQEGLSFWVDRIDPVEDVPAGAVHDTREYMTSHQTDPPG